ncbi:hypothetical protein [Rhizobacter sp. OV335]|uniref:hypothetical protein n=1 Tax=Rhizobacter sp. OV335 TaxID=1500264 RepID=UPI0011611C1D|nr:hypothetical protein [Rhizobacter sp. OV335]
MAKETKMTNIVFLYQVSIADLRLQFKLNVQESINKTLQFGRGNPSYVFAVVEIWLVQGESANLVIPATNPGNFIEDLNEIQKRIARPPALPALIPEVAPGRWSDWMAGYWWRLKEDCSLPDDEVEYERAIVLSLLDSRVGQVAIYSYGSESIIEISTQSDEDSRRDGAWAVFDPIALGADISHVKNKIISDVQLAAKVRKG